MKQLPEFESMILDESHKMTVEKLEVLQLNIGLLCNLECKHCHVEAGPHRKELMSKETMDMCLQFLKDENIKTLDITGGAPEMNPNFCYLVTEAKKIIDHVIVRTNLTVLNLPKYSHMIDFFKDNKLEVVSSLPFYTKLKTDKVRGDGVFNSSIKALQKLNEKGYGIDEDLVLNMVHNPSGAYFPPNQSQMEKEYKIKLKNDFGIEFNNLFTITNNPMGRFREFLKERGILEEYLEKLYTNFNPSTLPNLMCRYQLNVRYDGYLYDCDFNQACDLKVKNNLHIKDIVGKKYEIRKIQFADHCYGCTAGQGSSCGGATE